jgi:hypothetical protein
MAKMVEFDMEGFATDLRKEIQKEIVRLELIDTGLLFSSLNSFYIKDNKIVFIMPDYAEALEFGTYSLGKATRDEMPTKSSSSALALKKKDMPAELARKLGAGMVAFSFIRRIVYNEELIKSLILKNTRP